MCIRISYESDVKRAKQELLDLLANDPRVLAEPRPLVFVRELAESHVALAALPFVYVGDFLSFQWDITEHAKHAFEQAGVVIPYPQQEIHLVSQTQN
jgi:small conductance mechanosensitive channel